MTKKRVLIICGVLLWGILFSAIAVPMIDKELELRSIKKEIRVLEWQKSMLSWEINQLSLDRKKCEDLQNSAAEQAEGKRWEITLLETKITWLKEKYNQIVGFTQG